MENKYEDLEVHTSYKFDPATSICATYLWTENVGHPKDLVTATTYNTKGYKLWEDSQLEFMVKLQLIC